MKFLLSLAIAVASSLCAHAVFAQAWPSGPVTLIVPFAPGGSTDIAARLVAQQLTTRLGQSVLVVNRPGGTGIIGNGAVATARPDGQSSLN